MNARVALGVNAANFRFSFSSVAILAPSLISGIALFSFGPAPESLLCAVVGAAVLGVLLLYPELALALYVVIGDVKGDERVASLLPYDLTLALGAILLAGIALNFLRGKRRVSMPPAYFLLLALVTLMIVSLSYTPVFDAGLEKLERFLSVTGIVIVAPFFVLGTPQAMKRFLWGFAIVAFAICSWSLAELGGSDRLATPSDNTIGLGHIACALILLIWFAVVPRFLFPWRIFAYALLAVPAIALIGSGSRGPAIACSIVIFVSLFFYPRRWLDIACVAAMGFAALPFANIPVSSLDYLGTLDRQPKCDCADEFSRRPARLGLGDTPAAPVDRRWPAGLPLCFPESRALQLAAQHFSRNRVRDGNSGRADCLRCIHQRD